jgi:hypothetical protein
VISIYVAQGQALRFPANALNLRTADRETPTSDEEFGAPLDSRWAPDYVQNCLAKNSSTSKDSLFSDLRPPLQACHKAENAGGVADPIDTRALASVAQLSAVKISVKITALRHFVFRACSKTLSRNTSHPEARCAAVNFRLASIRHGLALCYRSYSPWQEQDERRCYK